MKAAGGTIAANGVQRSEVVGEHGAIAKLDVPGEGDYSVVATGGVPSGSSMLGFGINAASALAAKWKLLAGLVAAAFLIAIIPVPRHRRPGEGESAVPTGLPSSSSRAPYAG